MSKDEVAPQVRIYYDIQNDAFVLWDERSGQKLSLDMTHGLSGFLGAASASARQAAIAIQVSKTGQFVNAANPFRGV